MRDVVALGELLIDFTPGGETDQGAALFVRNPGGAPANVAVMAAKLEDSAAFIGKVGKDAFGGFLRQTLADRGVDCSGLVTDEQVPTTLAFVQLDESGDRSFTFYRKPGADMMLTVGEVDRGLVDDCRVFHFGSVSLTDEPCRSATLETAVYARKKGKLISFDPNYRPFLWRSGEEACEQMKKGIRLADVLKVSEEEMTLITGEPDWETGSQKLLDMGPSLVLVTMGEKGGAYRNRVCRGHLPAYDVEVADTTGAGDAFMGAVLHQLKELSAAKIASLDREVLEDVVDFANAAGSLTTTRGGAIPALPTLEEIETLRKK